MTETEAIRTEWTLDELHADAQRRFGDDPRRWEFVCPRCNDIACAHDFIDVGLHPDEATGVVGQECIGRHTTGRGCDWAAYGLIPGPWRVKMPSDGMAEPRVIRTFPLAPEQLQAPAAALLAPDDPIVSDVDGASDRASVANVCTHISDGEYVGGSGAPMVGSAGDRS